MPLDAPRGRLLRITRLMALVIYFGGLIQSGAVANYAELARLGNVTQARMMQIMNLLMPAPEIQEELLFQTPLDSGRDHLILRHLQDVAARSGWRGRKTIWKSLRSAVDCS